MKNVLFITLFMVFLAVLNSGCDGGSSSLVVYGTTGDAASANIAAPETSAFAKSRSEMEGSPTSLKIKQYELWVSPNSDCSNPVLVKDYGDFPQTFELAQGTVEMFTASPGDGTYNCVIFKAGSVVTFIPDSTASDAFSACTETEHSFDIFLEGQTFKDINGNDVEGEGTELAPVDDPMYLFASVDRDSIPETTAHQHQTLSMNTALVVPGNTYMIMNFDDLIFEEDVDGTMVCWVEAPVMGFSSTPSADAIKAWRACVSDGETVTTEATSGGNFWLGRDNIIIQYYGGGHTYVVSSSDDASWTSLSTPLSSKSITSAMALINPNQDVVIAGGAQSPIPGIYLEEFDTEGDWQNFSDQLSGFVPHNVIFDVDSVADYYYLSYSGGTSNGPVRVFSLPTDGSTNAWTNIGLDIANTTNHSYDMDSSGAMLYVTDTGSGLSAKRYNEDTGEWDSLGNRTTEEVESHAIASGGGLHMAYTMPSTYALTVDMYTRAVGWQSDGIGDLSGIRASGVKIDYVGRTIYILYKDVDNNNALTMKYFTLGESDNWVDIPEVIEANGPTVYDMKVSGQTPYVLYSHTDSGQTPLLCKKFSTP